VERRESVEISERKKTLAAMLANVAELGTERMEATIGKTGFRDAAIGTGIAVDKMLALTGQGPVVAVQVNIASPEERAKLDRDDAVLDAVVKRLKAGSS
jgi:hypothetical protein